MPKMKTVKSASKRFKVKKNNIKRGAAYRSHILTKKEPQKKCGILNRQKSFTQQTKQRSKNNFVWLNDILPLSFLISEARERSRKVTPSK
jgi:large subunit ribosomal protein L35